MTATILPSDASSLLVPVHLDAWVVDSSTQQGVAWYYSDFTQLQQFKSPIPEAFDTSDVSKPAPGVHLHWALPDALTHARSPAAGGEMDFPLVPNRWLIARFNTPTGGPWQCKLWVVQSDYLGAFVGTTSADLTGSGVTSIVLQPPGAGVSVGAGVALEVMSPDGSSSAVVTTSAATAQQGSQLAIEPYDFSTDLPAGSTVRLVATSAFLDPFQASYMEVTPDPSTPTTFNINLTSIGKSYTIEAWEARSQPDAGQLYLKAVGPGNVSFAAYVPFVKDVFSFTDTELPAEGTGLYSYTYMVVGWYSDPQQGDPLRGVTAYDPAVWQSQEDWQNQTPAERFQTLLTYLKWSVQGTVGSPPPSTSLYHGLVADVEWPSGTLGNEEIDRNNVHVAIGNTSVDALSALAQAEALWEANNNPPDQKSAWLTAGNVLAELMQAAMYDLLGDYDKPGGSILIQQQIEQAWFGSNPGGTLWEVVSDAPQTSDQSVTPVTLTPGQSEALARQLAALNQSQRSLDQAQRELESLQAQLYFMWWKVSRANSYGTGWDEGPDTTPDWSDLHPFVVSQYSTLFNQVWQQFCDVLQQQKNLPAPTDTDAANKWANTNWHFPDKNGELTLNLEDLGLKLKAGAMPRFWHPNDPVILISGLDRSQKHGEDGRYNKDGTLTCRLPGQTITGVQITGQPSINVQSLATGGVNLDPCGSHTTVPSIPTLLNEAFLVDPANAAVIAAAVGGNESTIQKAVTGLLQQTPDSNSWVGTAPTPFAMTQWEQAWAPLFLEWSLNYYPTGAGGQFSLQDWQFDGERYTWMGTGFDADSFITYKGRTLLTPQAPLVFKSKIEQYLKNYANIDSPQLDTLISTVAGWDVLSQTLSGLTDQLITLLSQETFPPPPGKDCPVPCPGGGDTQPNVAALINDEYHSMPVVEATNPEIFFPVRGGFAQFQALQIVDAFGQTYGGQIYGTQTQSVWINTEQGFQPILGQGLAPAVVSGSTSLSSLPYGSFQLPPRVAQSTRLEIHLLANDGSGQDINTSNNNNAVCGWLLPNHLDGAIAVYDSDGRLLGELSGVAGGNNWRIRPGAPGNDPPPQQPGDIPNAALRAVISSIAAQSADVFDDLLTVIDETLWMVDPLGGRKDQFLSVLIGRPLAVVQAEVRLCLLGDPVFNQLWDKTVSNPSAQPSDFKPLEDTGGVLDLAFPTRLGSLELRDDGLIGYFLTSGASDYSTFYAVHYPDEISKGDTYIRQIVEPRGGDGVAQYQGDIYLKCQGDAVTVTMLLDPRGSVHAYTGILPVQSAALPAHIVEDFIKQLKVTFRTGPIIADPGTLRIPKPAEEHGTWSWIQAVAAPTNWEQDTIVDANDQARLPDAQLQLREGWLQLSEINDSGPSDSASLPASGKHEQ